MIFGAMDHCDINPSVSQADHYAARLDQVALYDEAGFHGFHITEHHCTPLGGGAAPTAFLAAASQRTKRLRLGAFVFVIPLNHPIKLIEELCVVDQMSRGRLDMGFGRGSVPMELDLFGVDRDAARAIYEEGLACILQGLSEGRVDFHGKHFNFDNVPIPLRPVQQPLPPLWYGVHSLESAEWAARKGFSIVCNEPVADSASYMNRYREVWKQAQGTKPIGRIGLVRTVVVGDTDAQALGVAGRAYAVHNQSFTFLHRRFGVTPKLSGTDPSFEGHASGGRAIAGEAGRVADYLAREMTGVGADYCVMRLAFGDMSGDEMRRSASLFAEKVMPNLAKICA
jgi:alkanesulfonate monooxygenase SsuD/methylene tetrahydromethanopterin reductase-like flavin-dependent oxidoreductase (luciferase family)